LELDRPVTPPPPSSPSKLKSPSKTKAHFIPPTPHRPSIDAFWSQEVVNEWNDQYSPRKTLESPRKQRFPQSLGPSSDSNNGPSSPTTSPRKKSPTKRDKAAVEAKKAFEASKHQLAEDFLRELDHAVTGGEIARLAANTGGVKIVWSKKLNSTAGRANWRKETARKGEEVRVRHEASVELAEKVIDCEGTFHQPQSQYIPKDSWEDKRAS